ncbi:PAS domain-containing protein [Flavobacterium luminosum]|uniref:PAS domain-containing protein n=1 Tax=Flavobacterium luminosum TaxID=2949086 RepID=UPI0038CC0407
MDVSGYEDYELMSKPHNMIRHPDMPKVIFKYLWDNLKEGNNFHAIIKNMAKSGRYYWVITNFEVVKDKDGTIINYIGKRKAIPDSVIHSHIEPLYRRLLQIENASGLEASEKYLKGFLEEQNKTYMEYITFIMTGNKDKKGFFGNFFGKS